MESEDSVSLISVCIYIWIVSIYVYVSSPYLLVFGDDRVMHYTIANDVAGGASEA